MATVLYTEKDNGDLKLIAEVEGIDSPALAVDALLDDAPRLKDREFVALVGDGESGTFTKVVVEDDEPINPRRTIRVSVVNNGKVETTTKSAPRRQSRTAKPKSASNGRKAPAARKKPGPKPGTKRSTAKAKPGPKPKPRTAAASKPRAKGGSPFKRNAKSEE